MTCLTHRFLERLKLEACPKLKDDSLSRLLPLCGTLVHLGLDGCRGLQAKASYHLQRLTSLTYLSLQGLPVTHLSQIKLSLAF